MPPLGVVVGDVVADFELGFGQSGETAAVEQFGPEVALKRFSVRVVITVAAPAHALPRAVSGNQIFESGGRVLAALVGVDNKPNWWVTHGQGAAERLAHEVFRHRVTHVPADDFA